MMSYQTIIHSVDVSERDRQLIAAEIPGLWFERATYYLIEHEESVTQPVAAGLRQRLAFDINPLPKGFDPKSVYLLISDMDSTLIAVECIDEIAAVLGIKPQVAAITEAAMRGEIDFEAALRQRVKLLKGVSVEALQQVYDERIELTSGAEQMLAGLKQSGIKTALVSGGFTFFTERLQKRLSLDYALACVLEIEQGHLTGQIVSNIVDAKAKAQMLTDLCTELEIKPQQTVAIGDGANDLNMLASAGLSIAFRAHDKVREAADVCLHYSGLEGVCQLLQMDSAPYHAK